MIPQTLTGAHIKLYINNALFKTVQSVTWTVAYNEDPVYGIDSLYPQEIASTKISVTGSIQGIRLKLSGGLQAKDIRPVFTDANASPYISIRIQDRQSGEDIIYIPNAKVTRETHAIATKSTYKLNFDFIGQIPLFVLDRKD